MQNYEQQTPDSGQIIDAENDIIDLQDLFQGGSVVVTLTSSPDPVTPVGEATTPKIQNIPPKAGKFLNSSNEIIDLIEFLTSGAINVQVAGGVAPTDATYITSTDETDVLPNSFQLLGTANQIIVLDGALSLDEDLILPGTLTLTGVTEGVIKTPNGKNLTLAPGNPDLDWVDLQSKKVNVLESIIFNNATTNNIFYNSTLHEFYFNANNDRVLSLSSSGVSLGADLLLNVYKITSSAGTAIQLVPDNDADGIDLASTIVRVEQDIRHAGDETNKIAFTTAAQTNYIGGTSIFDINASGFRLGTGSRINTISNDPASILNTEAMTSEATQIAIANAGLGGNAFRGFWDASGGTYPITGGTGVAGAIEKGNWWRISVEGTLGGVDVKVGDEIFAIVDNPLQIDANWLKVSMAIYTATYITSTDETALLPNSLQLLGTANQIVVTDGVLSLDNDIVLPGTLTGTQGIQINNVSLSTNIYGETNLDVLAGDGYTGDLYIRTQFDGVDGGLISLQSYSSLNIRSGVGGIGSLVLVSQNTDTANGPVIVIGPRIVLQVAGSAIGNQIEINRLQYPRGADVAANGGVRIVTYNGTVAVQGIESFIPLNDGQILIGSSSGAPTAANLTPGDSIFIDNAANSITLNNALVRFQVTVGQADLASGASVTLFTSSDSKQYKVVNLWTSVGGTNFSGGGGDRDLSITDATTDYSIIPGSSLQAITANQAWGGGVALPFPAVAIDTSTAAGASLVAKYSGGTADYTAGSIVISGLLQRIA